MGNDPELQAAIEAHRCFEFGRTGIRRVAVHIYNQDQVAVSYLVDHLWERQGDQCRSLMHLIAPRGMKGTSLLMHEQSRSPDCHIWLRLSTAKRTVSIPMQSIGQYALGTDFTYSDLLYWYRFTAEDFRLVAGLCANDAGRTLVGEQCLTGPKSGHTRIRMRADGALLAHDRLTTDETQVLASYQANDWQSVAGGSFPTSIVKTRMNGQYMSEIRLLSLSFGRDVPSALLSEASLGDVALSAYANLLENPHYQALPPVEAAGCASCS